MKSKTEDMIVVLAFCSLILILIFTWLSKGPTTGHGKLLKLDYVERKIFNVYHLVDINTNERFFSYSNDFRIIYPDRSQNVEEIK